MSVKKYLPSGQFTVMVGALALSGGLVLAAQAWVRPSQTESGLVAAQNIAASTDWQAALAQVQEESGVKKLEAPDPGTVQTFLEAAQSPNLTATVGRTLLVNLSNAKSQGLGSDIPTQDQIIIQAAAQAKQNKAPVYETSDLTIISPQTKASLRQYGNEVMRTLQDHADASVPNTYAALGTATDTGKSDSLSSLPAIGKAYQALAKDLVSLPVPETMAPLHLQLANDFARIAETYPDMATMAEDPLRALSGVYQYSSLIDEATRVLTNIAEGLNRSGILFNKDEPGNAWSALLSP